MGKLIFIFLTLLSQFSVRSQIVNIPDLNFKTALLNHNPVINTNGDSEIQVSEAVAFSGAMDVSWKNISVITGIEAFINIHSLNCQGNRMTTLPLIGLSQLLNLRCSVNLLTSLDLSNTPNLGVLDCGNNQLTSLPLSNLNSLVSLDCSNNQLSSLVLPNPALLGNLWCHNNQLSSLPANLSSLKILICFENQLSSLPSGMNLLTHLDCSNNLISTISVDNCTSLQLLRFGNNLCTSFSLSNKLLLTELICDSNQLSMFSITNMPKMTDLDCSSNRLTALSFNNFPLLRNINCSDNQISGLQLTNLPSLFELVAGYNNLITFSLSNLPLLGILNINNNQISSLSLNNLPNLVNFSCSSNQLLQLDLSSVPVRILECSFNPNLSYINIRNNAITGNIHYITVTGLSLLQSICVDDAESIRVNTIINAQLPGQNVSVSTFCTPTIGFNTIIGTVRFDQNLNGCTSLDSTMNYTRVDITDGVQQGSTFTNYQGRFRFLVQRSPDTVTTVFPNNWFITSPASHILNFGGNGNTAIADFCVVANGIHPDLDIVLLPITTAIPGYNTRYKLVYKNKGNQLLSGTVTLNYNNNKLILQSSMPSVTSQTPGNLVWNYNGLSPYEGRTNDIEFRVLAPTTTNVGDTLFFRAAVNPITGDETTTDNIFNLKQIVSNSFDPNDKQVLEGDLISVDKLNDFLHYIIRFQNKGTANAINIVIKDSLSNNLDWVSFAPIAGSHPYRTVRTKGNLIEFMFEGINLPPSSVNEPASHGFIAFQIKPKKGLVPGDIVSNKADIYFDFNEPIVTNKVITMILKLGNDRNQLGLVLYSSPARDYITFSVRSGITIKNVSLFNMSGQKMSVKNIAGTASYRKMSILNFTAGVYFLEVGTDQGTAVQKIVVVR